MFVSSFGVPASLCCPMFFLFSCAFEILCFFFFNDTAPSAIYTLSLHDALPILPGSAGTGSHPPRREPDDPQQDRKSTRLNSSHVRSSYAVFCFKKTTNDTRGNHSCIRSVAKTC